MLKWDGICRPQHPHNGQGALSTQRGLTVWTITHGRKFPGRRSNDIVQLSIYKLPDQ